jgi:thiol-disulfide isomerase/thioredoxin
MSDTNRVANHWTSFTRDFAACVFRKSVVILCMTLGANTGYSSEAKLKVPKMGLPSLSGGAVFNGANFKSDVTVIQFWASWCVGCAVVMSQMSEILVQHPDLGYVSISLDEAPAVALKYFSNKNETTKKALNFSYLDASGEMFSAPNGVDTLPYLIVVDKQGTIIKRIQGHPTKADVELFTNKHAVSTPKKP